MEITKVYPLDAVYDSPEDVPEDVISKYSFNSWNEHFKIIYILGEIVMILFGAGKN